MIISKVWSTVPAVLWHHRCRGEREHELCPRSPGLWLQCPSPAHTDAWMVLDAVHQGQSPTQPPWLQPWKGQFHPREERLCLGTHRFPAPVSQPAGCPPRGSWDQAPAVALWLITTSSLFPLPLESATPALSSVPLHQGFVRSIAWIFGDEVASPSFSRLRGSWHIPGAGLLAVLRSRTKAGGARGDQEEMLEQVWEVVGSLRAARSCSAFLLVFALLKRFCCCCCCHHENPTKSCSFPEVKVAFSLP